MMRTPSLALAPICLVLAALLPAARAQDRAGSEPRAPSTSGGRFEAIAACDAARHAVVAVEAGHRARNPGQRWEARFDGRGFEVLPEGGSWTFGLQLARYGFRGALRDVAAPGRVAADGQRLTYAWDVDLLEWWINDARGLEHGFTLHDRPAGGAGGPLALVLGVRGQLVPRLEDGGTSVGFANADGDLVVAYSGLTVFDARGQRLAARFECSGRELNLFVDDAGAVYPLTIDPLVQQAYLKASNTGAADYFGTAIAIDGNTAVVGAYREDSAATGVDGVQTDDSKADSGAAYVFVRSGTTWTQQAYLKASNTGAGDAFGRAVACAVDTVVVAASGEDSGASGVNGNQADNSVLGSGAAYVFLRTGSAWSQQAYLKASNPGASDGFGRDVSISGDTILVSTPSEDSAATGVGGNQADDSVANAGAAYVFVRSGTAWTQQAYLKASNTGADDWFGFSSALSGDTIVVGAYHEDSNGIGVNATQGDDSATDAGAAYVFVRNGSSWTQHAYLKASNSRTFLWFGAEVAVSGSTCVIGAPNDESPATGVNGNQTAVGAVDSGAAYVFTEVDSAYGLYCAPTAVPTPCPCGNPGLAGRGCGNTSSSGGAALATSGSASLTLDTLVLHGAFGNPHGPGLYYSGTDTAGSSPPFVPFGNGLRCVGGTIVRLEVRFADGSGGSQTTIPLGAAGAATAGTTRYYQLWYRDNGNVGTCAPGAGFNFSSAVSVAWVP